MLTAALVVACATSPSPPIDPARAIHLQSRLTQAVAVEIGGGGGIAAYTTALRPCSGSVTLVPGLSGVPASELQIALLVDPSGMFDAQLARSSGHPHDLAGSFGGLTILWTTGEIQAPGLPRWITVTPEAVVVEGSPPAAETPCGPWFQRG